MSKDNKLTPHPYTVGKYEEMGKASDNDSYGSYGSQNPYEEAKKNGAVVTKASQASRGLMPDPTDTRIHYTSETEGGRDDAGKARYELIPPEAEEALAEVLTYGATKYVDRNWEKGMDIGRVEGSLRRHLAAYRLGEVNDPESGLHHLKHALANLAFMVTYIERGIGE